MTEETGKELGEPMEEDDDDKAREDRRRRRDGRRGGCDCVTRRRGVRRKIISQNPFIIFFLEMYYRTPDKHVTDVAREAGKAWRSLPIEDKKKYILLAERERKRRGKLRTTWEQRKQEAEAL